MATYAGNHSAAYKQQSILTAPPGRLVVMLYDGCLRFLFQAAYAMREGDRLGSQERMRRAEAILDELTVTLDHERGGAIASRLQGIYAFCRRHLMEAALEQDPGKIEAVSELLGELRDAWAEIASPAGGTEPTAPAPGVKVSHA
ncbi:MAG TPA: flagellar export chaperone FliS [Solirubrobacter sp.]|nr:flagellar export chaperone FliS [Solirubrobacter sp.]